LGFLHSTLGQLIRSSCKYRNFINQKIRLAPP
jgi:hypothetical protein